MKIWLGPAGIPITSKPKNTLEGIKVVAKLGLNAMEVQFVRGVKMSSEIAKKCGELAKSLNVLLSVHAPYYINLASSEPKKLENSKRMILDSAKRAEEMGAEIVVFHPGYYKNLSKEECFERIKNCCLELVEKVKVKLGLETMGKVSQFGELDEIIRMCKEVNGCVPVIDFAHIYARNAGRINYSEIFEKVKKLKHLHTHFTCVEFSQVGLKGLGNEKKHLELKTNKPSFKELAKEILKRKVSLTIISESPILEKDSLKMKEIFEKLGYEFK